LVDRAFNGAHLRIEPDALPYHQRFKNQLEVVWARYSEAAGKMQFDQDTPVFVATAAYRMQDDELIRVIGIG